jgi:prepilin-type N-terminal cleavage/methylation domain-containing protein
MLSRTGDEGMTLVELLISVTILGTILSAMTGVTFVSMRTATTADTRLDESNDLLLAGTYFAGDVMGAQTVVVSTTPRCGTDSSAVVEFRGQDFSDTTTFATMTTVITYVVRTVAGSPAPTRQLRRLSCKSTSATPTYPLVAVTDSPVVRQLSATAPTVSCGDPGCGAFDQVDLTVQEQSGGLTYTLTGRRRVT